MRDRTGLPCFYERVGRRRRVALGGNRHLAFRRSRSRLPGHDAGGADQDAEERRGEGLGATLLGCLH